MTFLGWIDYDDAHDREVRAALAALKDRNARDELGLGAVRDTFSDLFFPGTSTIQRRLAYFLFVPWCAARAAEKSRDVATLLARLERNEKLLIKLLPDDEDGVIGRTKGDELKVLPSAIYWSGLKTIGIVRFSQSISGWARREVTLRTRSHAKDDDAADAEPSFLMPPCPDDFLKENVDFRLTAGQAAFVADRLQVATRSDAPSDVDHNLFGPLRRDGRTEADSLWDHPAIVDLRVATRDLVDYAHAFSDVMYGATLLYNRALCELKAAEGEDAAGQAQEYRAELHDWAGSLDPKAPQLVMQALPDVTEIARRHRHNVTPSTRDFILDWCRLAHAPDAIAAKAAAAALVRNREIELKSRYGTSRFANAQARQRWNLKSGQRLTYRWPIVRQYLRDLAGADE